MVGIVGLLSREGEIPKAGHNNGMHPTYLSLAFINLASRDAGYVSRRAAGDGGR